MRIVFLSRWFPYPPDNGSKIRIFNAIKQLAQHHEIALITFAEATDEVDDRTLAVLGEFCSSIRTLPFRPYRPTSARALAGLFSASPRSIADTFSPEIHAAVNEACRTARTDLVIASQLGMAPYAMGVQGVPAVLEEVELSIFRDGLNATSPARRLRSRLTWLKLSAYLRRILPRFAVCTVVSERERENLRNVAPHYASVRVIPNAVDTSEYTGTYGSPRPNTAVFSGALTYSANYDALRYFLDEMYAPISEAVPDFRVRVTGRHNGIDIASLRAYPGVEYTGYLADVRPTVAQSWLSLVPLRQGGGTRLKILEAMALGTPVVASQKGADGLDVADGRDILLAADRQQFVEKTIHLLRSPALHERIAAGGRQLVKSKYDWAVVGHELNRIVDQVSAASAA